MTAPAPWTQEHSAGSAQAKTSTSPTDAPFVRADCCSARALFRVLLPATPTSPRGGELLLCGHHLRVQLAALRAARATILDAIGATA